MASQSIDPRQKVSLEASSFVYELFVYSAVKFDVSKSDIPDWELRDPSYDRVILAMSRAIFKYQITQRKSWSSLFNAQFLLNGFRTVDLTRYALMEVLRASIESVGCIFHKMLISMAVMNEFILFLFSNKCDLYLKDLAKFYDWYISIPWEDVEKNSEEFEEVCAHLRECKEPGGLWKEFEEAGSLGELFRRLELPKLEYLDSFYNEFIPKFCIPYHNEDKLPHLSHTFYDESVAYFKNLTKTHGKKSRRKYNNILNAIIWHDCRISPCIELMRGYEPNIPRYSPSVFFSEVYEISKTELWKLKPENAEPLLLNYDAWLKEHGFDMKCRRYIRSFQTLLRTSRQEAEMDRISPGQDKEQKAKSSSASFMEDIGRLNLSSSEEPPWSLMHENEGFQIGASYEIEESPQQKVGHRTRSSQEGRRKSTSGSYSGGEDCSWFNLNPLDTKPCDLDPVNMHLAIQSIEELLRDVDVPDVDVATSALNQPATGPQEVTKDHRRSNQGARPKTILDPSREMFRDPRKSTSSEEGELNKSISTLSLTERFQQFNLDPLETKSSNLKPVNIRSPEELYQDDDVPGENVSTSSLHQLGARPREVTKDHRRSNQRSRPKTKRDPSREIAGNLGRSTSSEGGELNKQTSILSLSERFEQFSLGPSERKPCTPQLVSTVLGMQSFKELIRNVNTSEANTASSSQNCPESREITGSGGSTSPEQGEIRKSDSLLSLAEGFPPLDLDSSESQSCTPEPENIGSGIQSSAESLQDVDISVADNAASSLNSPETREIAKGSSTSEEEEETSKSSSLSSLAEGFAQLNLGPP